MVKTFDSLTSNAVMIGTISISSGVVLRNYANKNKAMGLSHENVRQLLAFILSVILQLSIYFAAHHTS